MMKRTGRVRLGLTAAAIATGLALSACTGLQDYGGGTVGGGGGSGLAGAESGSRISLSGADAQALRVTALRAVETGGANSRHSYRGPSGATGTITVGPLVLVGLDNGADIAAPLGVDTRPSIEARGGTYSVQKTANVRLGPSTNAKIADQLAAGTRVRAVGHDKASDWYLVARGEQVLGYVFGPLIKEIPGDDLVLAGASPGPLMACREVTYRVVVPGGARSAWVNGACRRGGAGWAVVGGEAIPTS